MRFTLITLTKAFQTLNLSILGGKCICQTDISRHNGHTITEWLKLNSFKMRGQIIKSIFPVILLNFEKKIA